MTKQIRKCVFETNSSSSHSLTLSPGDLVAQPFSDAVLASGKLAVQVGEFGWAWERFYAPESKLSYLLTQITSGYLPDEEELNPGETLTDALLAKHDKLGILRDVVKAHTGVELVVERPAEPHYEKQWGYVDHESVGVGMELFADAEKLKQFLFAAGSYLETGNDNDGPSAMIDTDRGEEHFYAAHYGTPAEGAIAAKFALEFWPDRFMSPRGDEIETESPVMAQILESAVVMAVDWSDTSNYGMFDDDEPRGAMMGELAERGFKFSSELAVTVMGVPKAKNPRDAKRIAYLTVMLPQELATRFAEVH